MATKEEEEENKVIKSEMAEGIIPIYNNINTTPELKQKIIEELFDRLVRLESIEQTIINRRLYYEKWLNERGFFGAWDTIEELIKSKNCTYSLDKAYVFGRASGIYGVCTTLLSKQNKE